MTDLLNLCNPKNSFLHLFRGGGVGIISQVKGFAPIGMLELWNIGIMGSGIMNWWV
jgi:hypothetical protein